MYALALVPPGLPVECLHCAGSTPPAHAWASSASCCIILHILPPPPSHTEARESSVPAARSQAAPESLHPAQIGVKLDDKGGIVVDEFSRSVSVPNVFAVGDVTNRLPLTPVARMEGMQLAAHLFRCDKAWRSQF